MIKKVTTKFEPKLHHVQVSDELWELLLASAKQELRTPSSQLAYVLRSFLANEGNEHE